MAQAPDLMLDTNTRPTAPLTSAVAPVERAAGQPLVADVAVASTHARDAVLPTYKRAPGEIVRGEGV
jgi:hypothetical protein